MKKSYLTTIFIIGLFFIIGASSNYDPVTTEGFKNLKVLPKDISKEDLDSIMGTYAVSLGVRCGFCHAANKDSTIKKLDFASDAKDEKNIARSMMQMTDYLNVHYFNFENSNRTDTIHAVVCYSCHRGTKEPDAKVFITTVDSTLKSMRKQHK